MSPEFQLAGVLALASGLAVWLHSRAVRQLLRTVVFAEFLQLQPEDRVLVVAPHCDDETLGSGGLIHRAVRLGCAVHVVVVTNGDGFRYGVTERYRRLRPGPEAYIRYAYERQQETLAALARLGVGREHVEFLGYPDRGLARMWDHHWHPDRPYTSRFTRRNRSPYWNSRTPNAPYCGQSVLADLQAVLLEFRPTVVVLPHSYDAHIDHWATHAFVVYAVESLAVQRSDFVRPAMYAYLIHRGRWPYPKGRHPGMRLLPPPAMADVVERWLVLPLDAEAVQAKLEAILAYRSQIALMRSYLLSFARVNELFTPVESVPVRHVEPSEDPDAALSRPLLGPVLRDETAIRNPVRDTVMRRLQGRADIRALGAVRVGDQLLLRLELRRAPSGLVRYVLHVVALDGTAGRFTVQLRAREGNARVRMEDGAELDVPAARYALGWQVALPLALLGRPRRVFISAETRMARLQISSVGWTLLDLEPAPAMVP